MSRLCNPVYGGSVNNSRHFTVWLRFSFRFRTAIACQHSYWLSVLLLVKRITFECSYVINAQNVPLSVYGKQFQIVIAFTFSFTLFFITVM